VSTRQALTGPTTSMTGRADEVSDRPGGRTGNRSTFNFLTIIESRLNCKFESVLFEFFRGIQS
jgi:hypothetical protein